MPCFAHPRSVQNFSARTSMASNEITPSASSSSRQHCTWWAASCEVCIPWVHTLHLWKQFALATTLPQPTPLLMQPSFCGRCSPTVMASGLNGSVKLIKSYPPQNDRHSSLSGSPAFPGPLGGACGNAEARLFTHSTLNQSHPFHMYFLFDLSGALRAASNAQRTLAEAAS